METEESSPGTQALNDPRFPGLRYRARQKVFISNRLVERGEVVLLSGRVNRDHWEACGDGPLIEDGYAKPRFEIEGLEELSDVRRAELTATRKPSSDPRTGGHQGTYHKR